MFDWIKRHFANPVGVVKFENHQTGQIQEMKIQPWQPFLNNEIEMYGPAKLRGIDQLNPALNQLIELGLIVTVSLRTSIDKMNDIVAKHYPGMLA